MIEDLVGQILSIYWTSRTSLYALSLILQSIYLSLSLRTSLSLHQSIFLPIFLPLSGHLHITVYQPLQISVYLFSLSLSLVLRICQSLNWSVALFSLYTYLSICLTIFLADLSISFYAYLSGIPSYLSISPSTFLSTIISTRYLSIYKSLSTSISLLYFQKSVVHYLLPVIYLSIYFHVNLIISIHSNSPWSIHLSNI